LSFTLFISPSLMLRVIESRFVSDTSAGAAERCIWPGCTRSRAPGRTSGSGRQKEYCLQADPPERGGGPVHNARNRWAALRSGGDGRGAGNARRAELDAVSPGGQDGDLGGGPQPPGGSTAEDARGDWS